MDPVTLVVTAVALGASAGLKVTVSQVIKDAYAGLKGLLAGRKVDVSGLENAPDAPIQRAALADTLTRVPGGVDDALLAAAQALTDAVAAHDPAAATAIGVNVRDVQAEFLRVNSVTSTGTGLNVERATFSGGIDIGDVHAGTTPEPPARTADGRPDRP